MTILSVDQFGQIAEALRAQSVAVEPIRNLAPFARHIAPSPADPPHVKPCVLALAVRA